MSPASRRLIAVDMGAESGRVIAVEFQDNAIQINELHRYPSSHEERDGRHMWLYREHFENILEGLRKYVAQYGPEAAGIGVDTWGVDFALLGDDGQPLENPVMYRDPRTEGMIEAACEIVPREQIFKRTGVGFNVFNTIFQLLSLRRSRPELLDRARSALLMPDLYNYMLCGIQSNELTNASTTQLYDVARGEWRRDLFEALDLPEHLFQAPTAPGATLGPITPEVAAATGLAPNVSVIATGSHDTASAIAAVPCGDRDSMRQAVYCSCGTWSLFGVELDAPLLGEEALAADLSNELGADGRVTCLKNIIGLWLLQECRRAWESEGHTIDYGELTEAARAAEPFRAVIDADDPRLFAPENMPATLAELCRESGQPTPETHGQTARLALESLALQYRKTTRDLARLTGQTIERVHIFGGGSQNSLLCQLAADACGLPVYAGPVEATAIGNAAIQALGLGFFDSLESARALIADSFAVERFEPTNVDRWDEIARLVNAGGGSGQ